MTTVNVLSENNSKHVKCKVERFGSQANSDTFSFQGRNYSLEFFFGSWNDSIKKYTESNLYLECCKELQSPVEVTVQVFYDSKFLPTQQQSFKGTRQCIWSSSEHLSGSLLTFDIIIYADPSKNPIIRPICTESLLEDIGKLLENGENSDFALECGEKTFRVHRNILSARSGIFADRFRNKMLESGIVNIWDMDPDNLYHFLRYIYSGKIADVNKETAVDLYEVADRYKVPSLKRKCASFIEAELTEDNVCSVLLMADQYKDQELLEAAVVFAVNRNDFLKSDEWGVFSKEHQKLGFLVYKRSVNK